MRTVGEVMTPNPYALDVTSSIIDAARLMRDNDIGVVMVLDEDSELLGIVTDRDIVVRSVAEPGDPEFVHLGDIVSRELTTIGVEASLEYAEQLMCAHALRRLPVLDAGRPVGILSLGDLAREIEPDSVLGRICAAPANI